LFGASHPEAIVRTDTTIAGGLQLQRCVGFEGDKLTVISEFAVKTVLENLKWLLKRRPYSYDEAVSYRSRVYATFNHSKHTMYISYVAENSQTKNSTTYNNIQYCTSKMDV
jgi:hypothetical protein